MPYIKDLEKRGKINNIVNSIIRADINTNGDLNCLLFMLFRRIVGEEMSYNKCKGFLSELEECTHEIRRRFLIPYEDEAKDRNGDVK